MSAVELHETIDGNGLIVNYTTYKAKKEEIAQLKKENAELKQENEELKKKQEYIEKVIDEIEDMKSHMTDKDLFESMSLVNTMKLLIQQYNVAKYVTDYIRKELDNIPQDVMAVYGIDEHTLNGLRLQRVGSQLDYIFRIYKQAARAYVDTLKNDDSTDPPQVTDPPQDTDQKECEDVRTISIKSTFIPGNHIMRQNWKVSALRGGIQSFCDLTGRGVHEEFYIAVPTVDQRKTIIVSLENAIFLDAIWHYMIKLQITSGHLYDMLKSNMQYNFCTIDMSYTVWHRNMADELKETLHMHLEQYQHLCDRNTFENTSENKTKYDNLKTLMVNTLDGIKAKKKKLKASDITIGYAKDFFCMVRNKDYRQNYFIPFDTQKSPIVTKGLMHPVRTDATFDDTTKKIQEQYRLQNQATYVPGDNSNTEGQNSASECVICRAEKATHACVPCGHKCMCENCCKTFMRQTERKCPMCRQKVEQMTKIFGKRFNPFMLELPV